MRPKLQKTFVKILALRLRENHVLSEPEWVEDFFPPPHLIIPVLKKHTSPARSVRRSPVDLQKE